VDNINGTNSTGFIFKDGHLKDIVYIEALVKKAKRNDILAQRILYEIFSKDILLLCYRMTGNEEEAKDILQESFIIAFKRINRVKENSKFGAWLKQIAINNCLKYLKGKMYFERIDDNYEIVDNEEEDEWYKKVSFEQIMSEINLLADGCKQIFILYLLEDYKHKEIAAYLNISESTSKSQYQYALKLLQGRLRKYAR
jgi:RNA polymerase sigma-70 factor (ECF subfamily)